MLTPHCLWGWNVVSVWQLKDVAEFCTNAKSWLSLLEAVNRVVECVGSRAEISKL